jgi:hypothetical protein
MSRHHQPQPKQVAACEAETHGSFLAQGFEITEAKSKQILGHLALNFRLQKKV